MKTKALLNSVCLFGFFLVISLCWSSPFAYGQQLTDPQEVLALLAVRSQLEDPHRYLNWSRRQDPCNSHWKGVKCYINNTDGYFHVQELRLLCFNLSGTLAPELGQLIHVKILNFLWNNISGSIPKEVGNMAALELMLLSGNRLTGSLPDELGNLSNLNRLQLDGNLISGPIPRSFAKLLNVQHFHMNDNRFSGQIPPEISTLLSLEHVLLDNNNLSGYLPPELSQMRALEILQLDNNSFAGTSIPNSYGNISTLFKLSLRNCSLQGTIPDITGNSRLLYVDLSMNGLTGPLPTNIPQNIITIILSHNHLNGSIPSNFSGLPRLQRLYLDNNILSGFVPTTIWSNINFTSVTKVDINLEQNRLSDVSGILNIPENVTLNLQGNPVCTTANQTISEHCGPNSGSTQQQENLTKPVLVLSCLPKSCPTFYQYVPTLPEGTCICAAPFGVGVRLRSPSISKFLPYILDFNNFITKNVPNVTLNPEQMYVESITWEVVGPRLKMFLLFFPSYPNTILNASDVSAIANAFAAFTIHGDDDAFGPYDLLYFTGPYDPSLILPPISESSTGLSKGAVAGIVVGIISFAALIIVCLLIFFRRKYQASQVKSAKDPSTPKGTMKMDGVKPFGFEDLQTATSNFSISTQIGQGGYGKVYRGTLSDGAVVAIKRALQGSLQGDKEFYTEIEMLSRLHHRNLVSLVGYCDEKDEQMLVYEFMPNGSLHDLLSAKYRAPLNFATRLHIALGASRGIRYLHTEADPPIIHRDIKANNILLDSKFTPKVSDFGISRLAPIPDTSLGDTTAHVSTNVKGTPGYVDPDYYMTHKLTEKSDVYSLGVVFLELLTGMQPISHGRNIVREVNTACQSGMMFSVIDRSMGPYPSDCVKKFMALALRCSLEDTKDRPLMLEVVRELENIFVMLPESDSTALERNINMTSNSGTSVGSGHTSSDLYDRRSPYVSMDIPGSDLVSGVIHTIKPR